MLKTYGEALVDSMLQLLRKDDSIRIIGGGFGSIAHPDLSQPLRKEFNDRFISVPISELGNAGLGIGMALTGFHPLVNFGSGSFMFEAWPQVMNEAANMYYMSGGKTNCPAVFHCYVGIRNSGAAQHCHTPQAMLMNVPGLKIMAPATPLDVASLLPTAFSDRNPVIFIDHTKLLDIKGEVPGNAASIPFGKAEIKRKGSDVTVVTYSIILHDALDSAKRVSKKGINAEVVNLRTLVPMDWETILDSLAKTGRLVIADECHLSCSVASHIAGIVARDGFDLLKAPIKMVTALDVPIPFSPTLEKYVTPDSEKIEAAIIGVTQH